MANRDQGNYGTPPSVSGPTGGFGRGRPSTMQQNVGHQSTPMPGKGRGLIRDSSAYSAPGVAWTNASETGYQQPTAPSMNQGFNRGYQRGGGGNYGQKYSNTGFGNTSAPMPEVEHMTLSDPNAFNWPNAARKPPMGQTKTAGTDSGFNVGSRTASGFGNSSENFGFNSYKPPPDPAPVTSNTGFGGGFGSQNQGSDPAPATSITGFGGGFGFASASATGGFNVPSSDWDDAFFGGSSSTSRKYGEFKKSKNATLPPGERFKGSSPVKKDFYIEDAGITAMSDEEATALRLALNNVTVQDLSGSTRKSPKPVKTFAQAFREYPELLEQIDKQNFKQPSPIQCQMWPLALKGYDVIGIAQTGTGKTLGFLMPAFIHLDGQPGQRKGPGCLVLTPTRELARQIHQEVKKYRYKNMKDVCVYGGSGNRQSQVAACGEGIDILIATPGRLRDLVDDDVIDLSTITFVVLDEADRMLDMGFEPDIRGIMDEIRKDRQTVLTSATWPEGVRKIAESYMTEPFLIYVGSLDVSAVHSITQQLFVVSNEQKKEILIDFLNNMKPTEKVIIFVGRKATVDRLAEDLTCRGLKCQRIHGDREQIDREKALSDLKNGTVRILVATDVASRGLDIRDITHVINYDFPQSIEEYVHRVGRTGRAGKSGVSITLMTRGDWHHSTKMIQLLTDANQEVPPDLLRLSERYEEQKATLGLEGGTDQRPYPPRRRDRGRTGGGGTYGFTDPYTGESM